MVMLVAIGGAERCSLSFEKKGGAAEFVKKEYQQPARGNELPLFPLLIKRDGADVSPFPINNHPRSPPRCRIQRVPLWEIWRGPARMCPCPVLGLAQQRSAPCLAQARGLLSVY